MRWLLGPYREGRTYRIAVYLLIGLGLGILDFTLVVTGFSLGLGLLVTVLGIPVLVATLLVARALATMERRLASSLLDAPLPRRRRVRHEASGFFWARLRSLVSSRRTWAEVAFLLLRLPMGVLDFVFITALVGFALGGFAQPIVFAAGAEAEIGSWTIDTLGESLLFIPLSVVFLLVGARLVIGWSELPRRIAASLLGTIDTAEFKHEVAEVLARGGETDAFGILEQLRLRLGHGPFLTPTRVEATLLAMQSTGHVAAHSEGPTTTFTLAEASSRPILKLSPNPDPGTGRNIVNEPPHPNPDTRQRNA